MDILHTYKSRRNSVQLIKAENGIFVQKQYPRKESCIHEQMIYRLLHNTTLPHPEVAGVFFDRMTLVPLPGKTLLEELEEQEKSGIISWEVWKKLAEWVIRFNKITGFVVTDPNLRNFIYDAENEILYGLDFEECAEGDVMESIGRLAAFLLLYDPTYTPTKQTIAACILREAADRLAIEPETLLQKTKKQEALLQMRRRSRQ